MEFKLLRRVLEAEGEIDLTEAEFQAIRAARDVVSAGLVAEQKFDLVVENFREFEQELLSLSLEHSFSTYRRWESFAHDRQRVNRRLGNLTFAAKLLLDQMKTDAVALFGRDSPEQGRLLSAMDQQKTKLPHRTLLALRDQIRHQSFPEFGMAYQSGWEEYKGTKRLHFWFDIRLAVRALEEGRRPGDKERAELCELLRQSGEEIDLLDFARKHIESVAVVFEVLRELLGGRLGDGEALIGATLERARQELGEKLLGLAAVRIENRRVTEEVPVFDEPMKYRRALNAKNRALESISKRSVSGVSRTLQPK